MSKDVFMADYSECRQTNREIQSNLNIIEDILSRLKKMDGHAQEVSVSSDIWDKSDYEEEYATLKRYLNEETNRYSNFHSAFEEFHTPLEDIDSGLKSLLESALEFIEENGEYGIYMSVIKNSQLEEIESVLYQELIDQGVDHEDPLNIKKKTSPEFQELLNELLELDESELLSKIDEIGKKAEKSPAELILLDILSANKPNTYSDIVKDLSKEVAEGGLAALLTNKMLGKSLSKYELDIKSLTGQINKLNKELANSQLCQTKINIKTDILEKLKVIRETKISKVNKLNTTQTTLSTISKWLNVAGYVYIGVDISLTEYENYFENGYELDDVIVDTKFNVAGVLVSAEVGAEAGSYVGGLIGGPVGAGVGIAVGAVVAGVVGLLWDGVIKPVGIELYENVLEPAEEWIGDKVNDIGDWWDSLWW